MIPKKPSREIRQSSTEGPFTEYVLTQMKIKGLRPFSIVNATSGKVLPSMMTQISKGHVPTDPAVIDAIADALGVDRHKLRVRAGTQSLEWMAAALDVKKGDIFRQLRNREIPIYPSDKLAECLTSKGFPRRKSKYTVEVTRQYSENAFAVQMKDNSLSPRVKNGEIAVFAPTDTVKNDDFAIVATKTAILFGQIILAAPALYTVITVSPVVQSTTVEKKNVLYILADQRLNQSPTK